MSVVGVDFGCKNSVIAAAGRGGVDVILNGNSQRQNPSMVQFNQSRAVGEAASATAMSNFRHTITSMKRLVGLSFEDPRAKKEMALLPFECVRVKHAGGTCDDTIGVEVTLHDEPTIVGIEHVTGMMVKHLGMIAAKKAASKAQDGGGGAAGAASPRNAKPDEETYFPGDWVVAIPGFYTDAQRRAFLTGCSVAGIPRIQRLMHETTATALAYGIFKDIKKEFANQSKPTTVMFIDMGYSAYQVAVVSFEPGKLIVKSTHFDPDLGGREFDKAIAEWIATEFESKYGKKLSAPVRSKKKVMLKLMAAAEKAKKTLSPAGVKETRINVECLMDDLDFSKTLKTIDYEAMCKPLLDRLKAPITRALAEAGVTAKELKSVEIVGGSTRVACVKRTLAGILGLDANATNMGLSTTLNADESVARGAALQSAILSPRFKVLPYEIVEHQPYPIKISWDGETDKSDNQSVEVEGEVEGSEVPASSVTMFDRGSNFPVVRRVTLRRSGEFLVRASYEADASAGAGGLPSGVPMDIATFKIMAPAGTENRIRVNVKQDIHGSVMLSSAQMVEEVMEEEEEAPSAAEGEDAAAAAKKDDTAAAAAEGEKKEGDKAKAPAEGAEQPAASKKKKIKKTNLAFETSRPMQWSKAEADAAYELEVKMTNVDRVVRETADKRNELESYLYDMRDRIIGELSMYATEEARSAFSTKLEQMENWLYEDGFDATKSVYAEKLTEVRQLGDPIVFRKAESEQRGAAQSTLQRTVEKYKNFLNSCQGDENYAHITDEEQSKCHQKCDEVSSWMYDMMDKQGALPPHADPVVTVGDIHTKTRELSNVVSPIMHKPKPKPPKKEEKPAGSGEEKKGTGAESTAADKGKENGESGSEPMDVDTPAAPAADDSEPMQTD